MLFSLFDQAKPALYDSFCCRFHTTAFILSPLSSLMHTEMLMALGFMTKNPPIPSYKPTARPIVHLQYSSSSALFLMDHRIVRVADGRIPPVYRTFFQGKSIEDLRQSLFCTMLELDSIRIASQEELRRKEDYVKELMGLLMKVRKERDEAKAKCQKLLDKFLQAHPKEIQSGLSSIDDSPTGKSLKRGDSISSASECDSISLVSSPVQSIFGFEISDYYNRNHPPETDPQSQSHYPSSTSPAQPTTVATAAISGELPEFGSRVSVKSLPEKGKLLQAVMKAGPLLQTLLLAGPLPQWRHPPQPVTSFQIPPVSIPTINPGELVGIPENPPLLDCSNSCLKRKTLGSQNNELSMGLEEQLKKYQRLH